MNMGCSLIKFWWVLLVFLVGLESYAIVGCLEAERVALLKLKDVFNYPNGSALPSWQGQGDCCTWESVKCDNSTKRVTELFLHNTRPHELSNLPWSLNASYFLPFEELQVLDLSRNSLTGLFGKFRLNNLRGLSLSVNNLTKVPSFDLSSPTKLEDLQLDYNILTGSLPESIGGLTSLKYLNLESNNLNGSLAREGGLCKLKNLIELELSENYFMGHIPKCLANLSSLRYFAVANNHFDGPLPSSIIYSLKLLVFINLWHNYFKGSISFSLLANHSNLQFFVLSSYNQQDVKVETENPPFSPSFQLKILNLINCTVNKPSYKIPTFLHHQHDLRVLYIPHGNMVGSFPNWLLVNNSKLVYFNLTHNFLTGPLELNSTSKWPNMEEFDISSNPMGGEIPAPIGSVFPNLISLNMSSSLLQGSFPTSLADMRKLSVLDLSHNSLSGYLPQEFGKGSNDLQSLKLSDNNINGPFLPAGSNFTNLVSLHLANNNFTGRIPDGIMHSRDLRMLHLGNNQLHGEIPSWIGNFHNLTFLILSHNSLQGPIPSRFCELTKLQYLDSSYNNLSGTLPSCINMSSLSYLHLQGNQFSGPIPTVLTMSHILLTLDLMNNKFSGRIPKWIGSFLSLRILLLKGNKLEGLIPMNICQLKNISILDLSRNNLSGEVPSCFNNITFGKVDFSYGMRIGKVFVPLVSPTTVFGYDAKTNEYFKLRAKQGFKWYEEQEVDFMSKWRNELYKGDILNFMSGLDLSSNNLTGYIPQQMGYLSNLHTLNLSNNYLTGPIPNTFSNLKQIESLDLSHNMLSGQIPSQLIVLYSLSVFSVAHNNLSGRTPERVNQFGTFEANCYEGNPFLCGPPLDKNCSKSPGMETYSHGNKNDFKDAFVWSFVASFVVAFLSTVVVLYFNFYFYIQRGFRKQYCWLMMTKPRTRNLLHRC